MMMMIMFTVYVSDYDDDDDDDINRNIQNNESFKSAILFLMILAILKYQPTNNEDKTRYKELNISSSV